MSSQRQLVDEAHLVRVHEARVAHHVAAVGQVHREDRSASVLDRAAAVVVQLLVVVRLDVAPRERFLEVLEHRRVDRHDVLEVPVNRAVLDHHDLAVALENRRFDFADLLGQENRDVLLAVENLLARLPHARRDTSESVCRGQPSGGLVFCHDLFSGFSDHFGVNDGLRRIEFSVLNTCHAPSAAMASPFSAYLTGRCIEFVSSRGPALGPGSGLACLQAAQVVLISQL